MRVRLPGFTLLDPLARGGMGRVFRGVHDETGQPVAIKVTSTGSARERAAFAREVEALCPVLRETYARVHAYQEDRTKNNETRLMQQLAKVAPMLEFFRRWVPGPKQAYFIALNDDTLAELAKHPNIDGIKDATADLGRPTRILNNIGPGFSQLSGEDATTLASRIAGGHGGISVTCNIAPKLLAEMHNAFDAGNIARAMEINAQLMPVHDAMFC